MAHAAVVAPRVTVRSVGRERHLARDNAVGRNHRDLATGPTIATQFAARGTGKSPVHPDVTGLRGIESKDAAVHAAAVGVLHIRRRCHQTRAQVMGHRSPVRQSGMPGVDLDRRRRLIRMKHPLDDRTESELAVYDDLAIDPDPRVSCKENVREVIGAGWQHLGDAHRVLMPVPYVDIPYTGADVDDAPVPTIGRLITVRNARRTAGQHSHVHGEAVWVWWKPGQKHRSRVAYRRDTRGDSQALGRLAGIERSYIGMGGPRGVHDQRHEQETRNTGASDPSEGSIRALSRFRHGSNLHTSGISRTRTIPGIFMPPRAATTCPVARPAAIHSFRPFRTAASRHRSGLRRALTDSSQVHPGCIPKSIIAGARGAGKTKSNKNRQDMKAIRQAAGQAFAVAENERFSFVHIEAAI